MDDGNPQVVASQDKQASDSQSHQELQSCEGERVALLLMTAYAVDNMSLQDR